MRQPKARVPAAHGDRVAGIVRRMSRLALPGLVLSLVGCSGSSAVDGQGGGRGGANVDGDGAVQGGGGAGQGSGGAGAAGGAGGLSGSTGGARMDGGAADRVVTAGSGGATGAGGVDAGADVAGAGGSGGSSPSLFPNCKSLFDGATLNGWLPSSGTGLGNAPASWDIQDGALHMKGTVRGVLATGADYGDFRFIFSVRKLPKDATATDHNPCVLLWGHRPPPNDALGAIQIQAPTINMWDYRNGSVVIRGTRVGAVTIDLTKWSQCEILAHQGIGELRMACCQLSGTGDTPCKAVEILRFQDATAGHTGPIGLQVHNAGLHDEYKNICIEPNPVVNDLITTH
jgi:Domain of Unknown Function (DUF1080)